MPHAAFPSDPPSVVDSHCHLDFPDFDGEHDALIARARAAGVTRMVTICTRLRQEPQVRALAERFDGVFYAAGTHPMSAAEELCETFTRATGTPSVCLRAPGVFDDATYAVIERARAASPAAEWSPIWEYGAFLDVQDLADAVVAALTQPDLHGHHRKDRAGRGLRGW